MTKNRIEWAVLAASVLVVAAVIGLLLYEAIGGETPPDPVLTLLPDEAVDRANGWTVPARIENRGSDEAMTLTVEAAAEVAGTTETSVVTIDYLPGDSTVEVTFGFSSQPEGSISLRVVSFVRP